MGGELIAAISAVLVALITGVFAMYTRKQNRRVKKDGEEVTKRATQRAKESLLSMRMISATMLLCNATAIAVIDHKHNGEMTEARLAMQKAKEEYDNFAKELATELIQG